MSAGASTPVRRPSTSRVVEAVAPLLAILVVFEIGVSFLGPLLPQVQREFRLSAGAVAAALAVYHGVRLLFNVPMGGFIARSRLPVTLAAGSGVLSVGALIVSLAPSFAIVMLGRAIMGLGSALFFLSVHLWLARAATAETRAVVFSYHQVAAITGSAIGPALAGVLAGWLSWRFAAGLPVLAGIVALAIAPRLAEPTRNARPDPLPEAAGSAQRLPWRDLLGPTLNMFASMFYYGGVQATLVPLFAARELRLGPAAIGGILMLGTVQRFASAIVGGRLATRFGIRNTVVYGQIVLGLSILSFVPVTSGAGLIVAMSIVSFAHLGGSMVIALITDRTPERLWGTALGINRTMGDFGAMIAPILVGLLIDQFGFRIAFAATAGLVVLAAAASGLLTVQAPRAAAEIAA